MRLLSMFLVVACVVRVHAQVPGSAAPQLSPRAAYEQATRPLEITRRSPQNWSEAELDALKIATDEAKASCHARSADQFSGEDLLAYALLCAFAQEWKPVEEAASLYLIAYQRADPADKAKGFPKLSTAFDYKVQASLHLEDPDTAVLTARNMLRTVPWDEMASDATGSTVRYIQLIQNQQALSLLLQRQPMLLALLKTEGTSAASGPRAHAVYADAIALPAMEQFADQPAASAKAFAELEASVPANLSPDEAILIAETRRQYKLLGLSLPALEPTFWLLAPGSSIPDVQTSSGSATVFLLFPDWCNQCLAIGPRFSPLAKRLNEIGVRFYALLAQASPPPPPAAKEIPKAGGRSPRSGGAGRPNPSAVGVPTAAALLVGTPTITVPKETLDRFVATDFPLLVVVDHDGVVRNMQVAPDNALVPGGLVDQIVAWTMEHWPPHGGA